MLFHLRWSDWCFPDGALAADQPVFFVSGGTTDDSASYLLLTTMDDVGLRGIIVTNTATIADYAMQIQWKMMGRVEDTGVLVGLSAAKGWPAAHSTVTL